MATFQDQDNSMHGGAADGQVPGPYDEIGRAIADLPRPRRVRMSWRGKTTVVMVAAILLASVGLFVTGLASKSAAAQRAGQPPQTLPFVLPILFLLVIVPVMLITVLRQKPLLIDGEIGTARVTKRWAARHGPKIQYEFTTPLGEHFSRSASDGPGRLSVGMAVPVFYDAQRPKRQVALCASLYEIVMPGKE
jgi:hypothetical protein